LFQAIDARRFRADESPMRIMGLEEVGREADGLDEPISSEIAPEGTKIGIRETTRGARSNLASDVPYLCSAELG